VSFCGSFDWCCGLRFCPGNAARQEEDCQQADELNECHSYQHGCLQLADSFGLTGHSAHSAVSDESKAESNAQKGDSDSDSHVLVFLRVVVLLN
jgi:hypothetical protein